MQSSRTRKNRGAKPPRNQQGVMGQHLLHPPVIQPQIRHAQRLRYVVTAAVVNFGVTFGNVLDGIIVALTTTTAVQLFDQVKIKAVEVWAAPALGSSNQVSVQFTGNAGGALGDAKVWGSNSMGIEPAHVRAVPERMSEAALYQNAAAGQAFLLTAPAGAVVDVEVSFRNDNAAPTASAAVVAATAGEVYYRGLDSIAIATTNFVPQAPLTR